MGYNRPQRSWGKVIFSEASIKNSVYWGGGGWGGVGAWQGGMCGRLVSMVGGHAWQGGVHGRGACMAGGVHGGGGEMHGGGVCGKGACMAGGMHGGGGMCGGGGHAWHTVNERAVHFLLECILV